MFFSNELFSQIVELTLLYMNFLHDNENRLDLDKFSQVEPLGSFVGGPPLLYLVEQEFIRTLRVFEMGWSSNWHFP